MSLKVNKLKFIIPLACAILFTGLNGTALADKVEEDNIEVATKEALNQSYIYEVDSDTYITGDLNGQPVRRLREKEKVHAIYLDKEYGIFRTEDGIRGYVAIENLKRIEDKAKSKGISMVDKTIEENGERYKLTKGKEVGIVEIKDTSCIIVDDKGNEYEISIDYIDTGSNRRRNQNKATRGYTDDRSSNSSTGKLVEEAHRQVGRPYVSGDTGSRGFDCSGLTYYLYSSQAGITLPRSSSAQASAGKAVSKSELVPGDLVFFKTTSAPIGHVGIYIGDGNMVHASTGQAQMTVTSIHSSYFNQRYVTARRILD